ncbi:hypothetical protein SKAU_G00041590 [Synaphobranchus kaupii]|uniref:Uncharacterized protein n=1 Tax=Synaphobranchus kaupii TaxID=118154 RepID=A0A9Q1G1A2_SYNKA|nr:hypothetical protein SKAU_G00041590 [Synaphobranchus kaupii]
MRTGLGVSLTEEIYLKGGAPGSCVSPRGGHVTRPIARTAHVRRGRLAMTVLGVPASVWLPAQTRTH